MGAAATICHDLTAAVGPSWLASVWSSGFRGRLNFLCAQGFGPQGDDVRILNPVRCVRGQR